MPFLFNDGSRAGIPLAYTFTYGGVAVSWGSKIMEMGPVGVRAEPFDGNFSVSSLQSSFSDTDGSIWASLGYGTIGIGSSWSATVYVGGTMATEIVGPNETRLYRLNTGNSATQVVHTGKITDIRRQNRMVSITSKNNMARVSDLEWRFPVSNNKACDGSAQAWDRIVGTNLFFNRNIYSGFATNYATAFFNVEDNYTRFELYAFAGSSLGTNVAAVYPTPVGRGTLGVLGSFVFPGTAFYDNYTRVFFKGTFLGTYVGSITTADSAREFGFVDVNEAEGSKVGGSNYPVGRTRLQFAGGIPSFPQGSAFYWQQANFTLQETPANLWKEMLTGCCVTPLFGTNDIDSDTFATARRNTAYQTFTQIIPPAGGEVLGYLKNALEPLSALWSVSSANTFRLSTYGPRTLSEVIGTITGNEVISSSVETSDDTIVNNVTLEYGHVYETGSFSKKLQLKGSFWGSTNDFPKTIQSKWLNNDNDARITCQRLLSRFQKPVPKLTLEIPLTRLTADVGSLFAVTDTDMDYTSKVFEVVGWEKDLANNRTETLEMWDGDAVYRSKGYAKWEGDNSLTAVVSGTSLSGWGTGGTVNNINTDFFGTVFLWF